jgi:hypothetical protein
MAFGHGDPYAEAAGLELGGMKGRGGRSARILCTWARSAPSGLLTNISCDMEPFTNKGC